MAVGNCTDEDVEYDVVPVQGVQALPQFLLVSGTASMAVGTGMLLCTLLPAGLMPHLGLGLLLGGGLVALLGLFLRMRGKLEDLDQRVDRQANSAAPSSRDAAAAKALTPAPPVTGVKQVLPAHTMDHGHRVLRKGQRLRFCHVAKGKTSRTPREIAVVQIGENGSQVTYPNQATLHTESLRGGPVGGVILRHYGDQYRVELFRA